MEAANQRIRRFNQSRRTYKVTNVMKADGKMVGLLLSTLGVIVPESLLADFTIEKYLDQLDQALTLTARDRECLDELLHVAGRITSTQLEDAIAEQKRDGRKFEEILIEKHLLTQSERDVVLEFQRSHGGAALVSGELALGNILVTSGQVTRSQLSNALRRQEVSGRRIGEELIDAGTLTKSQVESGLRLQRKLIISALIVAVGLGPNAVVASTSEGARASSSIPVSVTVIANARIRNEYQVAQLRVTANDVSRGYVDIQDASRFSVATNSRVGYLLEFHPVSHLFESVEVRGLGSPVQLGADGGAIVQRGPLPPSLTHVLGFRFFLSPNTAPGNYAWPLLLSIHTLD
jgi:hypothetical protein